MALQKHSPALRRVGLLCLPLILALLCTGCGGRALAEREIIYAVLFERQGSDWSACLLLADQGGAEGASACKTASARGRTPAQAMQLAEDSLPGTVYYGLIDLLALPPDCDWATAQEIGTLLYDKAQPAPEISVFLLDGQSTRSWAQDADALYETMRSIERTEGIHCGLQQLFARENVCAVPCCRAGGGYDFALLAKDAAPLRVSGTAAGLAAVLCGQTRQLRGTLAQGSVRLQAKAEVTVESSSVRLHLRDTRFTVLDGGDHDCKRLLTQALQANFAVLWQYTQTTQTDPFSFDFAQGLLYGAGSKMQSPELVVSFE